MIAYDRGLLTKTNGRMFGKRGGIPPLPRNCERRELGKQMTCSHWGVNPWEGSLDSWSVSQETGSARTNFRGENEISQAKPPMQKVLRLARRVRFACAGGSGRNCSRDNR